MEKTEKKLKILIADDEPLTKMDLKEMLIEAGYEVTGDVADGFDAVEACRRERPDLALLDIRMPYLDGLSAAKIIFVQDATENGTMFPPQFGTMFAKPCVGVVSKIDIATPQQIADAEAFLRAAGAGRIFRISSVTGEGVKALAEELEA